jgi:hypothetical protein
MFSKESHSLPRVIYGHTSQVLIWQIFLSASLSYVVLFQKYSLWYAYISLDKRAIYFYVTFFKNALQPFASTVYFHSSDKLILGLFKSV